MERTIFKKVKSFIGHEIRNDNHEKTTSKSAKWFNKDICRLIRAKKIDCTAEQQHLGRATSGRFTVLLAIKQLMLLEFPRQNFTIRNPGEPKLSSIQVVAIGQRTLWSEWKKFNSYFPTSYLCSGHCEKRSRKGQSPESYLYQPKHLPFNLEGFPIGPTQLKSVFTIQDICPADVRKIIKSLPNKASFGSDEISYRLLKEAGPGVVGPLTTLFNLSLHSIRVPDEWKEAIVCPIFKGGRKARQDPTNYRPLSLAAWLEQWRNWWTTSC